MWLNEHKAELLKAMSVDELKRIYIKWHGGREKMTPGQIAIAAKIPWEKIYQNICEERGADTLL